MDLKNTFITIDSPQCRKKFTYFTYFLLTVLAGMSQSLRFSFCVKFVHLFYHCAFFFF